jgi:hypothetical protein
MIGYGMKRACIESIPMSNHSDAHLSSARIERRSGLGWITSNSMSRACTRRKTWRTSSNGWSQLFGLLLPILTDLGRSQWDGRSGTPPPHPVLGGVPMETALAGVGDSLNRRAQAQVVSPSSFNNNVDRSGPPRWDQPTLTSPRDLELDNRPYSARQLSARGPTLAPIRSDTMNSDSSMRLEALAHVATSSNGVPNPESRPGTARPQHQVHLQHPPLVQPRPSKEDEHSRALQAVSNMLAATITENRNRNNQTQEELNELILRVFTSDLWKIGKNASNSNNHGQTNGTPKGPFPSAPQVPSESQQGASSPSSGSASSADAGLETVSREEVARGLRALGDKVKQKFGSKSKLSPSASRQNFLIEGKAKSCPYPNCTNTFMRNCDLRKHLKRHKRPYGCTFQNCNKCFGSKSDWKRHENSQHFQMPTWRCAVPVSSKSSSPDPNEPDANHQHKDASEAARAAATTPSSGPPSLPMNPLAVCGKVYTREEAFREHLEKKHGFPCGPLSPSNPTEIATPGSIAYELKARKIGANGQTRFWCGFCCTTVDLKEKRDKAWDERFNHIDEHFKNGHNVKDWWCMHAMKTKGEVARITSRSYFEDEDELPTPITQDRTYSQGQGYMGMGGSTVAPARYEESPDSGAETGDEVSGAFINGGRPGAMDRGREMEGPGFASINKGKKRLASQEPGGRDDKKRKYETLWFCVSLNTPFIVISTPFLLARSYQLLFEFFSLAALLDFWDVLRIEKPFAYFF